MFPIARQSVAGECAGDRPAALAREVRCVARARRGRRAGASRGADGRPRFGRSPAAGDAAAAQRLQQRRAEARIGAVLRHRDADARRAQTARARPRRCRMSSRRAPSWPVDGQRPSSENVIGAAWSAAARRAAVADRGDGQRDGGARARSTAAPMTAQASRASARQSASFCVVRLRASAGRDAAAGWPRPSPRARAAGC